MADNKPSFFKRLFGGQAEALPTPPPPAPAHVPVAPALIAAPTLPPGALQPPPTPPAEPASAEPLAPAETAPVEPAPSVLAEPEVLAGPPEASVDFLEAIETATFAPALEPFVPAPLPPAAPVSIAPIAPPTPAPPATGPRQNWLQRLTFGLKRSSDQLAGGITSLFTKKKLDASTLDELEDLLIQADFGLETTEAVTETLRRDRFNRDISADDVRRVLSVEVVKVLAPVAQPLVIDRSKHPYVILMIGVNGSGKTTTIGKLAAKFRADGLKVMLAAGDTFRAAAIEQLQVWGQRTGAEVVARPAGSDASGLAFDAVTRARAENLDVLIIDTAGRLQNRDELMSELEKIIRVIRKVDPEAPHATLLTLDATTGQNALNQVEIFGKRAGVTGLVMTKLDGTARGGILVAIARKFGLPVHFIGVGETIDDLEPFAAADFAAAIAGRDI
jgi:fused signal recognition particle receptor